MHVGMISYCLPVVGKKRGGIERVAHDLAEGLTRKGHRVRVWSYDPRPPGASYEVVPMPFRKFFQSWLGHRLTMGYLGNLFSLWVNTEGCDVIVAHGDSLLLPLKHRRVIRIFHGSALAEALSSKSFLRAVAQFGVYLQEIASAFLCREAVAVSQATRKHHPWVRRVISNGVNLSGFSPNGSQKTPDPSILFVGTLGGRKRGSMLLGWFENNIRPRFPAARLHMVCPSGPPLPGVTYHPGSGETELAMLYRSAWVLASPSEYEGFGLPYIEAMASGTAVIATPNPGSEEVLENGAFGCLATDTEFADRLIELLSNELERRRLAEAGLSRAREFDLERTVASYEQLIRGISEERKAA